MNQHRFDIVSAVFGIVAVTAGGLVVSGTTDLSSRNGAIWLTITALGIGIALLPWRRRHEES